MSLRAIVQALGGELYDEGLCWAPFSKTAKWRERPIPIYVGQTNERLRTRIRRHLTNQRTDAVAMSVLDRFEVLEIEVWPLPASQDSTRSDPDRDVGFALDVRCCHWSVDRVAALRKVGSCLCNHQVAGNTKNLFGWRRSIGLCLAIGLLSIALTRASKNLEGQST